MKFRSGGDGVAGRLRLLTIWLAKAPVHLYRWTLKPFVGWQCRHLPTCSDYALEAFDKNGVWRGGWLVVSRLYRCQPLGTAGYDPVPDIACEIHRWAPWRYGRWTGAHMKTQARPDECRRCC